MEISVLKTSSLKPKSYNKFFIILKEDHSWDIMINSKTLTLEIDDDGYWILPGKHRDYAIDDFLDCIDLIDKSIIEIEIMTEINN